VYRDKREIWEEERTVVVFISEKLKAGQIRGIYQSLKKKQKQLRELQKSLFLKLPCLCLPGCLLKGLSALISLSEFDTLPQFLYI